MNNILIIEDEKMLREMYEQKLSENNINTFSAESADNAFAILEKENIDLVLLDILLPKQNGIQILKKIRENPKIKNVKVIAFSNLDDPNIKRQAKTYNVIDYLIKTDFTPKEIMQRIKQYL